MVITVLSAVVVVVVLLQDSGNMYSEGPGGKTVTDLAGREVSVPARVERLVALGPGALRLVVYLGATDLIAGIEYIEERMPSGVYTRPYAGVLDETFFSLPVVGAGGAGVLPDVERILMCDPDLIIALSIDPGRLDNIQSKTGIPALYLSYGELGVWRSEAQQSLSLLGEVLGRPNRAAAINEYIRLAEQDLDNRAADIPENNRPLVYFGGISHKGGHGLTSTEAGYPPGSMAGARNLADGLGKSGHFFVDKEQILVWDPDFIFVDVASRRILDDDFERNREFYRLLSAGKSRRVLSLLPYNYYNTNIELALLNAYFVAKSLYPERCGDINMADKAAEIMATFLGIQPNQDIPAYQHLEFPENGPIDWGLDGRD